MTRHRRDFLKFGAALPLALRSLASAAPKPATPPRRTVFICNSLGFYEPNFFPQKRGDLATSEYLKSFGAMEKMTVFQNLFHEGMDTSNHDSEKSFLTGAPYPEATNFTNTISLDQVLAREIGGDTRFPFLSFSIYDRGWGCSWNDRGVAIPPMHDPQQIFDKLFGEEDLTAKREQIRSDQQIARSLHRDIELLESKGGQRGQAGDRAKLDSYRTVVAELEARLTHEEFWLEAKKPEVANTLSTDPEFAFSTHVGNLLELAKLALQTDSTRVITISLDWIYGAISVPGATAGWHTLSHHSKRPELLKQLFCVERELLRRLDHFLNELDGIEEGSDSLLDHTSVVIGSNFGDASNHTCHNLPTILAGGGYRHQAHRAMPKPAPLCNLYLDLLRHHGVDAEGFGNSDAADPKLLRG